MYKNSLNEGRYYQKSVGKVSIANLMIIFFIITMFSRLVVYLGIPSIFNFIHYGLILLFLFLVSSNGIRFLSIRYLLLSLLFLVLIILSAIVNKSGLLNVLLSFILLAEPFILLLIFSSAQWSKRKILLLEQSILLFWIINIIFSYVQLILSRNLGDNIKGVFLNMGAGHHVTGAIGLTAAFYFYYYPFKNKISKWLFLVSSSSLVIISDSKQTILVFILALVCLMFFYLKRFKRVLVYLFFFFIFSFLIYILSKTIFPALNAWANIDLIKMGLEQKFSVFSVINSYHKDYLNLLFGLGPGHTITRLGWLIPEYMPILEQFGVTVSPITQTVFDYQQSHWISNSVTGSSIWSLMFSWAGVWGDIGLLGFTIYSMLWLLVIHTFRKDSLSLFIVFTIIIHGLIFSWLEEPNYILFCFMLLGLRLQKVVRIK